MKISVNFINVSFLKKSTFQPPWCATLSGTVYLEKIGCVSKGSVLQCTVSVMIVSVMAVSGKAVSVRIVSNCR